MSLKLKGIKSIANKLKNSQRERRDKDGATAPLKTKAMSMTQRPSKAQLDSAYIEPTPRQRKKQQGALSDVSVVGRFDSFDVGTPTSVAESSASSMTSSMASARENDSVKVYVRVRPPSDKELKEGNDISVEKTGNSSLRIQTPEGYKAFAFDAVIGDTVDQEMLFRSNSNSPFITPIVPLAYAAPIVERCLSGYNGCIFAYGQTGSGKTYTMLGDLALRDHHHLGPSAGIIPRVFEHLFALLEERRNVSGNLEFECKCSFLEIYNETITDLLDPKKSNLHVREDKTGTHAAGLTEQHVHSVDEAVALMNVGASNRKVAHTQMNAVSSRSHSILSCIIVTRRRNDQGVVSILRSRLNLVDLAGSERQSTTGVSGLRLKEASSINKSLSTLGLVILSLGDTKGRKAKHIPYRDSKLTFLLQDSLGGNANAVMISNISPSTKNIGETLSTLRFARGAKRVKNKAVANHDCVDNIPSLKAEILMLKQELTALKEKALILEQEREEECDAMQEGCHINPIEEIPHLGLDKTLASALRREDAAHRTVLALSEEIVLLQSAVDIKESEIRKHKLMGKLKDDKIRRLEGMIRKQSREAQGDSEEVQRLKEEVEFFKEKASNTPDATRYAIENMQLKHELSTLKWNMECNSKDRSDEQIRELREALLKVNEEIKAYKAMGLDVSDSTVSNGVVSIVHPAKGIRSLLVKYQRREKEEVMSQYWMSLTQWAKTMVGVITKPLVKLRNRMKAKSEAARA